MRQLYPAVICVMLLPLIMGCKSYPVSGRLVNFGPDLKSSIYLVDPVHFGGLVASYEGKVVDSASVAEDGSFRFERMPLAKEPHIYLITVQKKGEKYGNKLENEEPSRANYLPFLYAAGKKVIISADVANMLLSADISGDVDGNRSLMALARARVNLYKKNNTSLESMDDSNLLEHEEARYKFQAGLNNFADSLDNFYADVLALRWMSPEGDYERIPEFVKSRCLKYYNTDFSNHPWQRQLCARAETLPSIAGEVLPDFMLPLLHGDSTSLSSLLGAKMTVVDLWASWCAPCRRENTTVLVPLWNKYHHAGFQIVGYALDSSKKGLETAIARDGADKWPQTSHLQGDVSPFFEKLRISTIPANYILDARGVILAKNLHGEELTAFVDKYMEEGIR